MKSGFHVETLNFERTAPGILGLGMIERVAASQVDRIADVQQQSA